MLSIQGILNLLNDKNYKVPPFISKWRGVYYGMSLHTTGACPAFRILKEGANQGNSKLIKDFKGGWIYPVNFYGWQYQQLFELYLLNRHPREPEETFQWRLSQYKPYTRTPFQKCMEVVSGAIFQDSNYSVVMEDKDDNDYIWGANFNNKTLIDYIKSNFQWICEDPNGVFVTIPAEPYYATTTSSIQPRVYFIPSKDIIALTDDEIIFNIRDIAWVVNNIGYFRFQKSNETGKYIHIDGDKGGFYAHLLGRIPMIMAGGIWNTQGFYDSWLNAAKAVADDFVTNKSSEQLVNKEVSHPFIIETSTDCPDCNPSGMISETCEITDETPNGIRLVRCPRCGGTHSISHNPGQRLIAPADDMDKKLVQIINPDVKVNDFHKENCQDIYKAIMEALHMNYIEQAQSGIAKDKDMETRYQFICNISDDIFDRIITGLLIDILSLRNVIVEEGNTKPAPSSFYITKPTQFQIKTAAQLLEEYKLLIESEMPDYVRRKHIEDYVDKQFGGDEVMKQKTSLINQMDVFAVTTEAEKQSRVLNGAASSRQYQFNSELPGILDNLIRLRGNEWFCNTKYADIKKLVDEEFGKIPLIEPLAKGLTSQDKLTG